jgi:hypothetical protein
MVNFIEYILLISRMHIGSFFFLFIEHLSGPILLEFFNLLCYNNSQIFKDLVENGLEFIYKFHIFQNSKILY